MLVSGVRELRFEPVENLCMCDEAVPLNILL